MQEKWIRERRLEKLAGVMPRCEIQSKRTSREFFSGPDLPHYGFDLFESTIGDEPSVQHWLPIQRSFSLSFKSAMYSLILGNNLSVPRPHQGIVFFRLPAEPVAP